LGWAGLQAQSRAPRRQPTRTPERVVAAVLAVRAELQAHRSRASRFSGIGAEAIRLQLPLARGRVSFIRKINDHGCIQVNGQPYFIGKRLARQYVTATVYPHRRTLVVKHEGRVRKRFAFPVHERLIAPLSRPHKP
jgi:hypothetical protein